MPPNLERDTRPVIDRALMEELRKQAAERGLDDLSPSQLVSFILKQWLRPKVEPAASLPKKKVAKAVAEPPSGSGYHERVYALLLAASDESRTCGPIGFKQLAARLSISANFARTLVKDLIAAGRLVEESPRAGSRGATYRLVEHGNAVTSGTEET